MTIGCFFTRRKETVKFINLTAPLSAFATQHHADLTVMPDGEHWFHTKEQMQFLDHWVRERSLKDVCG